MKAGNLRAAARDHHDVVEAIVRNFDGIAKELIARRGYWTHVDSGTLLRILSDLPDIPRHIQRTARWAADLAERIDFFNPRLSRDDRLAIAACEAALHGTRSIDETLKTIKHLHEIADPEADIRIGLAFAAELIEAGRHSIYSPDYMMRLCVETFRDAPPGAVQEAFGGPLVRNPIWMIIEMHADDVAGAFVGAVAGGTAGAVAGAGGGAVPGAVGGAIASSIGFSGKTAWDEIKRNFKHLAWGGHHGPTDPNGPIGPPRNPPPN